VAAGEKWYTPHRTHLYQRPVVMGAGHRAVLLAAASGMVLVAGCAVVWSRLSGLGRFTLLAVPVVLFLSGLLVVRRMERRA
jgi:hypothetical protein